MCGQSLPLVKREMLFVMNGFPSDNTMCDNYLTAVPFITCSALAALLITLPGRPWLPSLLAF